MLELELELSFELAEQIIPASQIAKLMNVYWFAENIGLVKMHWQGGTLEQTFEINHTLVSEQVVIPALAEDQLVFVCIVLKEEVIECKP
ncbi:MAG: hypothetical protein GWO08_14625, partial [Gammaproteobacteria bacterium]|nr:hypothetical protein [Gammaproteobacteria bacterium]NIW45448.1 hypothetical protein [Gammaproteobacteria bacterium]